jgi:DNA polymerase-3 subunit alpha
MLDGANKLDALAKAVKAKGMNALGISDHGNMFGAIDFYKKMKSEGIKPIIGLESYVHNHENIGYKEPIDMPFKQRFHLCLFAKNEIGYKNLMRLSSESFLHGFFYFPRINRNLLEKYHEGLICSSACLAGEINFHLNRKAKRNLEFRKGYEGALSAAKWYKQIFGEDFYLEIMRHGIEEQHYIDDHVIALAKELDIKLIATNDVHYTERQNAEAQEAYMCISSGKTLRDPNRLKHSVKEFFLKSPEEMAMLFADIPEALSNTLEICDKCNLDLRLGNPTPPNYKFAHEAAKRHGLTLSDRETYSHENDALLFETLCRVMLKSRLARIEASEHSRYNDRLEREIGVIKDMKFCGYMLIVWDFVNKAKEMGIPVGPGRGSAAGSLVAYALGITNIDPIKYGLFFERFLNPERVSLPDIDMDFCQTRRAEIIDYVVKAYGRENVAQVITFGSLLARGVIRDTARVLNIPIPEADRMAKLVPQEIGITLQRAIELEPKLKELVESDENARTIWQLALQLEGLKRNSGVHAAGLVISNEPLWQKTPLYRPTGTNDVVTQYDGRFLEDVDLIKFDFLGLQTLTVIELALGLIKKRTGKEIDFSAMDMDDPNVFELISTGNTLGIFQIESDGLQNFSRRLKPSCFEELFAIIALYRPGPLESGMTDDFVECKHGRRAATYIFAELEPILAPTYGVIVYQEQVLQIVQTIGGFSLGKADLVRKAMGKKIEEEMEKARAEFIDGAVANGYDRHKVLELSELIKKFAQYGFNKAHSAAYAAITYQTAYLKRYYPAEYMSAMLTLDAARSERVAVYINEVKRLGFDLVPPNINKSQIDFEPNYENGKPQIVFGLGAIKGIGVVALEFIIKARDEIGGEFKTLGEFLSKVDSQKVNKKVIESLIKSGAMDVFGYSRRALLGAIDKIVQTAQDASNIRKETKGGLFDDEAESMASAITIEIPRLEELPLKDILDYEKESTGIYVSGHPLDNFRQDLESLNYVNSADVEDLEDGSEAIFIGKVESIESKISKKGNKFGVVGLIDLVGTLEMTIFERDLEKLRVMDIDRPIAFKVSVDKNERRTGFTVRSVMSLDEMKTAAPPKSAPRKEAYQGKAAPRTASKVDNTPITLEFSIDESIEVLERLYSIIRANPGAKPVMVKISLDKNDIVMTTPLFASEKVREEARKIGVFCKG